MDRLLSNKIMISGVRSWYLRGGVVWTLLVVVAAPLLDDDLDLFERVTVVLV